MRRNVFRLSSPSPFSLSSSSSSRPSPPAMPPASVASSRIGRRPRLARGGERGGVGRAGGIVLGPVPPLSFATMTSQSSSSFRCEAAFSSSSSCDGGRGGSDGNGGGVMVEPPSKEEQKRPPRPKKAKKVTPQYLLLKKNRGEKITMVTAYDYPSALHVDRAGIDVLLVGDSCAMVELGHETTQPITLDEMIHHCKAVKRGAPTRPLLVGDMPFGTYEYTDVDVGLRNAFRMVKEGGMDAVKLEGGSAARARTVRHIVEGGVAVLGHVGLTPQAISVLGGFRAQGRTASRARALLDDALRLQDAGAFGVVLECVPPNVAAAITDALDVPTVGIGAGGGTSGQVLVFHDLLGMTSHPHHEEFVPKFCKQYAMVGHDIHAGLAQFRRDVEGGTFPGERYAPYAMSEGERRKFDEFLTADDDGAGMRSEGKGRKEAAEGWKGNADECEPLSLYGNDTSKDKDQ